MPATKSSPTPIVATWKTVLTILALVFFAPLGLIFMFIWMKWPRWVKAVITVLMILPILFFIIAVLAAIVVAKINPIELAHQSRDTKRIMHFADIQHAINQSIAESKSPYLLCLGSKNPCEGQSNDFSNANIQSLSGNGWVKADLTGTFADGLLPIDPINSPKLYYQYCSDGVDWEINTSLESEQYSPKAAADEGDNPTLYEVGSSLTVCP